MKLILFSFLFFTSIAQADISIVYEPGGNSGLAPAAGAAVGGAINGIVGGLGRVPPAHTYTEQEKAAADAKAATDAANAERERVKALTNGPSPTVAKGERASTEIKERSGYFSSSTSDKIANRILLKQISQAQGELGGDLKNYDTTQLGVELSSWDRASERKTKTLGLVQEYAKQAGRLSSVQNKEIYTYADQALQSGLTSLTESAQIAGEHAQGNWEESFGVSESTLEIAKCLLDVGLSFTPGVSVGKDAYEALSGKSLIDGRELDLTTRSIAVLGVVTLGGSSIVKNSLKGFIHLGELLHSRGAISEFESAIHLAETGIVDIARHSPINPGILHDIGIKNPTTAMQTVADTFRSGTYISYKTTEPLTLYRVTSAERVAYESRYWTRVQPLSPSQAMIDSALDRSWGSAANRWVQIQVPPGTTLHEGASASIQRIGNAMSNFVGGGNQVYIGQDVPAEWVVGTVKEFLK